MRQASGQKARYQAAVQYSAGWATDKAPCKVTGDCDCNDCNDCNSSLVHRHSPEATFLRPLSQRPHRGQERVAGGLGRWAEPGG